MYAQRHMGMNEEEWKNLAYFRLMEKLSHFQQDRINFPSIWAELLSSVVIENSKRRFVRYRYPRVYAFFLLNSRNSLQLDDAMSECTNWNTSNQREYFRCASLLFFFVIAVVLVRQPY